MPTLNYCENDVIFDAAGVVTDITYPMRTVYVDTTGGAVTLNLPTNPVIGEQHWFKDYKSSFATSGFLLKGGLWLVEKPFSTTLASEVDFNKRNQAVLYEFDMNSTWRILAYYGGQ